MNQMVTELKERIRVLADGVRNGNITADNCNAYVYDVIHAAAEIYKNDVQLYMPVSDGRMLVYREEERNYIPLFTDSTPADIGAEEYQKTTLREKCAYIYDNLYYYDLLTHPDIAVEQGKNISEFMEYVKSNPKFEGIVLNPGTAYPFGLDGWIFQAVMFKGMGVASFDVIEGETGEVKHSL